MVRGADICGNRNGFAAKIVSHPRQPITQASGPGFNSKRDSGKTVRHVRARKSLKWMKAASNSALGISPGYCRQWLRAGTVNDRLAVSPLKRIADRRYAAVVHAYKHRVGGIGHLLGAMGHGRARNPAGQPPRMFRPTRTDCGNRVPGSRHSLREARTQPAGAHNPNRRRNRTFGFRQVMPISF